MSNLLDGLTLTKPSGAPDRLVDSEGVVHVPEGYHWCSECGLLTPFTWDDRRWYRLCVICGGSTMAGYGACPNCHAEDDDADGPFSWEVIQHNPGCHCRDEEASSVHMASRAYRVCEEFERDVQRMLARMFPDNIKGWDEHWHFPEDLKKNAVARRWRARIREAKAMTCGCPRVTVYSSLNIRNYSSRTYGSQDCVSAVEWSYERRCPICGTWYWISDSNC